MSESKQEGITAKKAQDFDEWYTQAILKSELADYSPVSGCLVYRPAGYAIWEKIRDAADKEFKKAGIQNAYFPLFIPERLLKKEQKHVEGFAPEVAWVTEAGNSKLEERLAIRPTSETIIYEVVRKWIRSWRDLPLRLNLWNNVVRWEFKHPTPFLRGREFLWNEGHTMFATRDEADAERDQILGIYRRVTEEFLALPGLVGKKTDSEKFAGALASFSIEHVMPNGKAIQGPDFHSDGQNFAKAFDLTFVDQTGEKQFVWQNTWAITTREIGVMVATHGDDKGLIIPPKVAPIQVVIVPIVNDETRSRVLEEAKRIRDLLQDSCSVRLDDRDFLTPGRKFNEWELRGVPLRLEIGPRDINQGQVVLVRRDTSMKRAAKIIEVVAEVGRELDDIQRSLFARASETLRASVRTAKNYDELKALLAKEGGVVQAPWCGTPECEDKVKAETGAKIVNIPFDQPAEIGACVACGNPGKSIANFAKSY
ncbi:MAG: proline--tRNA ligase [Thaumarchaeota archaeon]|nr:proline--tRNA ligase [Nitrososphaerota archaeon]